MADDRCDLLCIDMPVAERLRKLRIAEGEAKTAAARARGLSDPTRLMLAASLREADELCVCDLSWIAERAENLVSHHLRELRLAGLVRPRRDGKLVFYSLSEEGRALLDTVLQPAHIGFARDGASEGPGR